MQVKLVATTKPDPAYFADCEDANFDVAAMTAEDLIIYIARVSSNRKDKALDPIPLLRYTLQHGHISPFEQADMTIKVVTSRAISAQLIRHKSLSVQEFSQRYAQVNEFEDIDFRLRGTSNRQGSTVSVMIRDGNVKCRPYGFAREEPDYQILADRIEAHLQEAKAIYNELVGDDAHIAAECARMILPMASQTTLFLKGSVRSWIHFLQARDHKDAQKEAQDIAKAIKAIFAEQFPNIHAAVFTEAI